MAACGLGTGACHPLPPVGEGPPLRTISVSELQQRRVELKGQKVLVEGFLSKDLKNFVLVQGSLNTTPSERRRGRYTSWCWSPEKAEPLWIPMRDLRAQWPRLGEGPESTAGVHVVLEGTFDDENVKPFDEEGNPNSLISMGGDNSKIYPGEYLGMGPLRNAKLRRVYSDRCEGMPPVH